jgi:hypothetical protein
MPLTRSFRETVRARARRDIEFRQALLGEAMQALLDGNLEEGCSALRSCINAWPGADGPARSGPTASAKACARRKDLSAFLFGSVRLSAHVFFSDIRRDAALAVRLEISLNDLPD